MSRRRARSRQARNPGSQTPRTELASERLIEKRDGNWWVRSITGATSVKNYRCPGCQQEIFPATPHVVVWPEIKALLSSEAIDERRHWHRPCWDRKS